MNCYRSASSTKKRPLLHPRPAGKPHILAFLSGVIASAAKQSRTCIDQALDCFVALLLAMTAFVQKRCLSHFSPDYFFSGIVMIIPPITSFSLKFFFGLSGWVLWHPMQACETALSA